MPTKRSRPDDATIPHGRRVSTPLMTAARIRRKPLHARGQATFNHILAITAGLLEEVGHENVTTNLIAQAAGINISTLYGYFSNKQAILLALFDRQNEERSAVARKLIGGVRDGKPWREAFASGIDTAVAMRKSQRGALALRLAMRSSPELQEHDRADSEVIVDELVEELHSIAGLEPAHARIVARCSMEITTSLLDLWVREGQTADMRLIEEAKRAILAYMAIYFESGATKDSSQAK